MLLNETAPLDEAFITARNSARQLNELGLQQQARRQFAEAERSWLAALAQEPDLLAARGNLANLYAATGRGQQAESAYRLALEVARTAGQRADLLNNLGNLYEQDKRYPAALAAYAEALAHSPAHPTALSMGAWLARKTCDWSERWQVPLGPLSGWLPFAVLSLLDHPARQREAAQAWAQAELPAAAPLWQGERYDHPRLRIAYLSWDFHAHATLHLMAELFEAHDRARIELYAFDWGPDDGSALRARVKKSFAHFETVTDQSDEAVARRLRALEIDVAVDLKGYTAHARPGIFAYRPCPVQVNYLGYPGTLGTDCMDYLLADEYLIPPGAESHYREAVVRLPGCYQANDSRRERPAAAPSRTACGLPETGFVFCCFNHNYKITPEVFAVWMRLLARVEGSVLWLLADNPWSRENLAQSASRHGIDPARLIFAPRADLAAHLARHHHVDLFLDTCPCNAHTTASDALWMGVPLLTLSGESFAARVAGSLLTALGLSELITRTLDAYEAQALVLAQTPQRLRELRRRLEDARESSGVFDGRRLARQLEIAFVAMSQRAQAGLPPVAMAFQPLPKTPMKSLHLGCGRNILPGWINLDCVSLPGVDVVADLDRCDEIPLPFADDSLDSFLMSHVLEHIQRPLPLMQELWRVAKSGAHLEIRVPYGSSDDAFEDPTHVRQYFEGSFGYFGQPFHWRADYGYRGDWQVKRVRLKFRAADHAGLSAEQVFARIRTLRNQVSEMIVELEAIKPARATDPALQQTLAIELEAV